ncbi:Glutathione synthetase [Basidiobolus ranarum]|uniref:Glutathione synthetase n=1 Tax=Basidiobolus ranarum TaxID=34480 RepID=A0ABR2WYX4_9FUNG
MPYTFPQYPPSASPALLEELKQVALDWAFAHGLVMRGPVDTQTGLPPAGEVINAPFALFPSPFPKHCFQEALELQPAMNQLLHTISEDHEFLQEIMESLSNVDEFMKNLYDIFLKVKKEGFSQSVSLGIHRSDYLLHAVGEQEPIIQQVEFNTIASSFGSLTGLTGQLHKYLVNYIQNFHPEFDTSLFAEESLPESKSFTGIAKGLAQAHEIFGVKEAVILFVVQPNERNIFDQRWIEYNLLNNHGVRVVRKTLAEVAEQVTLDDNRNLLIDGKQISVTYFRSGYGPNDHPTTKEWDARLLIERSRSIKCPTIAYQLVGAKKVQQVLAKPSLLERFVKDKTIAKRIRDSFAGLYPLDGTPEGRAAADMASNEPDRFVMKPQREGGGNNIYGQDIPDTLKNMSVEQQSAYILMDLIVPPTIENVVVRQGQLYDGKFVSELGVYGIWISDGSKVLVNENAGHLLRTKLSDTKEGGVATGFAVIDSPLLV